MRFRGCSRKSVKYSSSTIVPNLKGFSILRLFSLRLFKQTCGGTGAGEGIGTNGIVRGPVQGAATRMRHDGVCLTTVRPAQRGYKGGVSRQVTGADPFLPADRSAPCPSGLVREHQGATLYTEAATYEVRVHQGPVLPTAQKPSPRYGYQFSKS